MQGADKKLLDPFLLPFVFNRADILTKERILRCLSNETGDTSRLVCNTFHVCTLSAFRQMKTDAFYYNQCKKLPSCDASYFTWSVAILNSFNKYTLKSPEPLVTADHQRFNNRTWTTNVNYCVQEAGLPSIVNEEHYKMKHHFRMVVTSYLSSKYLYP
ncbi:hypothetical protein TNCV_2244951 [Trichonephila clavipes]|nr:hypothetical protein TNCV_2244951 [Trichonephila clavipes]